MTFKSLRAALVAPLIALASTNIALGDGAAIEVGGPMGTMILDSAQAGEIIPLDGAAFQWIGSMTNVAMGWQLDWDLVIDGDPSVSGVASFTNLMGGTADFTYNVSALSTESIAAPTVSGASTITLIDANANGATMAALLSSSIYDAHIENVSEQTLFDDPYSLTATQTVPGFDGAGWGPQAAVSSIAIGDTFGIDHEFSLTSGDQATVNSSFFIVPEPATGLLLLLGVAAIRRRQS